jgi:phosphate transport system permease protein
VSAPGQAIGRRSSGSRAKDVGFQAAMLACLGISMLLLGTLLVDIAIDGVPAIDADFLWNYPSSVADQAGLRPAILGTLYLMVVCIVFIVPVGVATAVYLEE